MTTSSTFIHLDSHEDFFKKHGKHISYGKQQYVVRGDDPVPYVYFIESGLVKLTFMPASYDERIIGYLTPGMTFAQMRSFFEADGGNLDTIAVEPTTLYRIERKRFLTQLAVSGKFKDDYLQQLMRNQIYLLERTLYMGESSIYNRMVRWLSLMAKYYGTPAPDGAVHVSPELTQATIGSFLHASRESVSKSLRDLEKANVIRVESKHIVVVSTEALHEASKTNHSPA